MDYKVITFRGVEKCDIPYYIAKTLVSNNNKVLFIDNSISSDMFSSLEGYAQEPSLGISKGEIVFVKNSEPSPELCEKFDYIVYYIGMSKDITTLGDNNYIISDYRAHMIDKIRENFNPIFFNVSFIMRDKISEKIKENVLSELFGIDENKIAGYIFFDEKDYSNYINLTFNGIQGIEVSSDMREALRFILMDITKESESEVAKNYINKGKRNKRI